MKIKVTSNFDVQKILDSRGLGKEKRARKYLANRVRLRCMPYTPRRQGTLSNTSHITNSGDAVVWDQPYAHYQYKGEVMGPNVLTENGWRSMAKKGEKFYTGKALNHRGSPIRGPEWDKRMMADHREDIEKDVAAYIAREGKK